MKKYTLLALSLFLIACSGSKKYYEPSTSSTLNTVKIEQNKTLNKYKSYELINQKGELKYLSNSLGFLKILKGDELVFDKKFDAQIVSIASEGNKAVMVDALNNVIVFDLLEQQYLFSDNYSSSSGVTKLASPVFSGNVIIVPTLNGNLVVLNNPDNTFIRSISVGTQEVFNNVIYLKANEDKLVSASSSRLFTILENKTHTKLLNIKTLTADDDFIYVLTSGGEIYKYNYALEEQISAKYKYANFSNVYLYNHFLYALEHTGYLIKLDENLNEIAVFNLKSKIKDDAYFKDDLLFFNGKSYRLQ